MTARFLLMAADEFRMGDLPFNQTEMPCDIRSA
jgi:hypothetical protein